MTPDVLACSVRGCHKPLTRRPGSYGCDGGHAFDVARSGYVNLLQPQDRRSAAPGDRREAALARARLLTLGIGRAVVEAMVSTAADCLAPVDDGTALPAVADLGCGSGELLATLARRTPILGIGIDLSADAVDIAARQHPALTWVGANADRRLPLLDGCTALVLSLHARRNPAECARVLAATGRLIVAVPAADDLAELRALVQGEALLRDRIAHVVEEHQALFVLAATRSAREHHVVTDAAILEDLLEGTYRGARRRTIPADATAAGFGVTVASEILVFARR